MSDLDTQLDKEYRDSFNQLHPDEEWWWNLQQERKGIVEHPKGYSAFQIMQMAFKYYSSRRLDLLLALREYVNRHTYEYCLINFCSMKGRINGYLTRMNLYSYYWHEPIADGAL